MSKRDRVRRRPPPRDARRADDARGRPRHEDEAGARPPRRACTTPPDERMTSGSVSPASAHAPPRELQVAARDRPQIRVDRGGRGALVLPELRGDLVRGDDARAGQAACAPPRRRAARASSRGRRRAGRPPPPQPRTAARESRSSGVERPLPAPCARERRSTAPAGRAAQGIERRAGRGGRASAVRRCRRCSKPPWRRTPSARPCARGARSSRPSSRA